MSPEILITELVLNINYMLKTGMFTNDILNIGHRIYIAGNGIDEILNDIHERVTEMFLSLVNDVLD